MSSSDIFKALQKAGQEVFGPGAIDVHVHFTKAPVKCDHDWPQDQGGINDNPNCTKCGISFTRYAFTECP